jgi:hypothetical protein
MLASIKAGARFVQLPKNRKNPKNYDMHLPPPTIFEEWKL